MVLCERYGRPLLFPFCRRVDWTVMGRGTTAANLPTTVPAVVSSLGSSERYGTLTREWSGRLKVDDPPPQLTNLGRLGTLWTRLDAPIKDISLCVLVEGNCRSRLPLKMTALIS